MEIAFVVIFGLTAVLILLLWLGNRANKRDNDYR